jgi:hypothetical protein
MVLWSNGMAVNQVRMKVWRRVALWHGMAACILGLAACSKGGGSSESLAPLNPVSASTTLDIYPARIDAGPINLVAGGYVPLHQGDTWAYDSEAEGSTTVGGVTRAVLSGPDDAGQVVIQELEDTDATTETFVVAANGITQIDPFDSIDALPGIARDLPQWLMFANAAVSTGDTRIVDTAGDAGIDLDGDDKNERYRLHVIQTFKGLKTLPVLGQPTEVAHVLIQYVVEFRYTGDHSPRMITITLSEGYAPGLGLVQADRIVADSDGNVLVQQALSLRAAHVNGVNHNVSSAQLDQTALVQILPTLGGISNDVYKGHVTLTLSQPQAHVQVGHTELGQGIESVSTTALDSLHTRVDVLFKSGFTLGPGSFNDTLTITACVDRACKLPVSGSPFSVPTTAIVAQTQMPEAGVTALVPLSQQVLTHDVVAARYSRALGRVVMVASAPDNRLYLLNPATGTETSLALSRTPTALALSPDGSEAAVGHDGRVTWVDLATVGQAQADARQLNLSAKAFDLVLDATRHVHVAANSDQFEPLRTLDVATNTEALSTTTNGQNAVNFFHGRSRIALRPDGTALYTEDTALSPIRLKQWGLNAGQPGYVNDSNQVLTQELCEGLWWANDGQRMLTGCGLFVKSAPGSSTDMGYDSTLPLTAQGTGSAAYRLRDTQQHPDNGDWAVLEFAWMDCGISSYSSNGGCFHHLNVYADDSYTLKSKLGLGPVALAGSAYDQEGVAVFHSADGQHTYLITHLVRMATPTSAYLFQVVR